MGNKETMLLTKISNQLPGQEKEFLEFMAGTVNSSINWETKSIEELLNNFIEFEEDNNEEELTEEVVDQVLEIYVEGFISGEGVF
jgi:hypothetical protein